MRNACGVLAASLLCVLALVAPASPWGDAPTHPSLGMSLLPMLESLPSGTVDPARFVRATACADLANTQLFKSNGFGYVHTPEFAAILWDKAKSAGNPAYRATALAWVAHLAADEVAHRTYIYPLEEPLHSLVEVAVDTLIYYGADASVFSAGPGFQRWEDTALQGNDCSPILVANASKAYVSRHGGKPISWFQVWLATQALATSIQAEYGYLRLKGDATASWLFLESLDRTANLDNAYVDSANLAACRIGQLLDPSGTSCP